MSKFTGKFRYRIKTRFLRHPLLILQLQVQGAVVTDYSGRSIQTATQTWWIDARPEFLLENVVIEGITNE